jgi:hypothetical protein
LWEAWRELRIEALKRLPALLLALKDEAEQAAKAMEDAKTFPVRASSGACCASIAIIFALAC